MKQIPTQDRLMELYHYDPETGVFRHRQTRGGKFTGEVAGSQKDSGYIILTVDYIRYPAHCLAYLYMTGDYPPTGVDHFDKNKVNNQWLNLRLANKSQNGANSKNRKNNTTGFKGVTWHAQRGKFAAQIMVDRRHIHLGLRDTPEECAALYAEAAARYFGEFAST